MPQVWAGDSWEEPKSPGSTNKGHPALLLPLLSFTWLSTDTCISFQFCLSWKSCKRGQLFPNSCPYSGLQAHRPCILEGPLPTFSPSGPLWLRSLKRLKCTPISLQIWDLPELISPSDSQIWHEEMSQGGKGWGALFTSTLAPPGLPSPQAF